MTSPAIFPALAEPIRIGDLTVRNRILSSGHDTVLVHDGAVTDDLIAYHEARAAGGVGLIVVQVAGVHETARYTSHVLMATSDECISGYRRLAAAIHRHGSAAIGQLFHPGREITESADGTMPVALAPSAVPTERFRVMPRPMTEAQIQDVLDGYAAAAVRLRTAGMDGVEVVASHGYLPAQFLNPSTNLRQDGWGGTSEARLRFLREALRRVRAATGPGFVVGVRLSGDELTEGGLHTDAAASVARTLDTEGLVDYISVCAGSSATLAGSLHIAAPMSESAAYVAPLAAAVRAVVEVPVMVAGRINQPQEAELILARGQADMCAMTRAMICDPEMPAKALSGRHDDIRACIGCNQACIGHFQAGVPISCIQHPETGREREFGTVQISRRRRSVLVVGGGPAGLKAATVAAARGHDVTVCEAARRVGGQVLLAERLPGRAEFGGAVTNLVAEAHRLGVRIETGVRVDRDLVAERRPDVVVLATGSRPYTPPLEVLDDPVIVQGADVVGGRTLPSGHVLVADRQGAWSGLGVATELAGRGHRVTLAVTGFAPGEALQQYVRTAMLRAALAAKVEVLPHSRLVGIDEDTAYLQNTLSEEPVILSDVAATVLTQGNVPDTDLDLVGLLELPGLEVHEIGDRLAARTVEEAVLDGLRIGTRL